VGRLRGGGRDDASGGGRASDLGAAARVLKVGVATRFGLRFQLTEYLRQLYRKFPLDPETTLEAVRALARQR
jgi:hypothetical protein